MGSRAHIAKIEKDGSGRYIYLGHGCYPDDAGMILLEHYQEESKIERLIAKGSIPHVDTEIEDTYSYYDDGYEEWENNKPTEFNGGTQQFFEHPYIPSEEWLYAWTPDGWFAAQVTNERPPQNFHQKLATLEPEQFQHWFDNNQEPEWIEWRSRTIKSQRPQPLYKIIETYIEKKANSKVNREATA